VGGTVGALLTGVFSQKAWSNVADGLLFGNPYQVVIQAISIGAVILYGAVATFVLLKAIGLVVELRAESGEEGLGLDVTQHGEEAYTRGEGAILVLPELEAPAVAAAVRLSAEGGRA
jgi:Amt family ammonium transporter